MPSASSFRMRRRCFACLPICSNSSWKATASAWRATAARSPSPHRPRCGAKSEPTAQHAFFQWLHQGPREAPVEFIVPVDASHPLADQQTLLVANALAQAQALMVGRSRGCRQGRVDGAGHRRDADLEAAVAARVCPGQSRVDDAADAGVEPLPAGTAACVVRASDLRRGDALRHQPVRRIRRRIRQDARGAHRRGARPTALRLPADTDGSTRGLVAHVRKQTGLAGR